MDEEEERRKRKEKKENNWKEIQETPLWLRDL